MLSSLQHLRRLSTLNRRSLELTLALIKPDASSNPMIVEKIQDIIHENFYIVRTRFLKLSLQEAEEFYECHRGKFFFNRLVTFMSSGPIYAHVLAQDDAIAKWRTSMGPTKSYRAQYEAPSSVRGQFGLTDTRNAVHGSDSTESARREIRFFFPSFDVEAWLRNEEPRFTSSNLTFDPRSFEHRLRSC